MRISKVIIIKELQNSARIDASWFSVLFFNSCRSCFVLAFTSTKNVYFTIYICTRAFLVTNINRTELSLSSIAEGHEY